MPNADPAGHITNADATTVVDDTTQFDDELLNSPARPDGDNGCEDEGDNVPLETDVEMEDVSKDDGLEDVAGLYN